MQQHVFRHASRFGAVRRAFTAVVHCLMSLTVALVSIGCCEGKPLLGSMEDNGADEVIVVVNRLQVFQLARSHAEEPVFTGHHRKPSAQVVRSISAEDESPLEGHRYSNGLNAPMRT